MTPTFPSLYWPVLPSLNEAKYLYHALDIARFTLLWTVIIFASVHIAASLIAVATHRKSWKTVWVVPVVYAAVAGLEGLLAGSAVGGL